MKKLSIVVILIILQAFNLGGNDYDKAKFSVSNNSDTTIDSLIITNHQSDEINSKVAYKLKSNESKDIEIDMTEAGGDGNYVISHKLNGEWYNEAFGYYTNGGQTEELISIRIIDEDSLIIDYNLKDEY